MIIDMVSLSVNYHLSFIKLIITIGRYLSGKCPNVPKETLENYRPISLTNVDYRILAFILSQRLQSVIGKIIDSDQSAYIKGRYFGTNIRLMSDIIEYYDMKNKSGLILSLDFEKAFDHADKDFLKKLKEAHPSLTHNDLRLCAYLRLNLISKEIF